MEVAAVGNLRDNGMMDPHSVISDVCDVIPLVPLFSRSLMQWKLAIAQTLFSLNYCLPPTNSFGAFFTLWSPTHLHVPFSSPSQLPNVRQEWQVTALQKPKGKWRRPRCICSLAFAIDFGCLGSWKDSHWMAEWILRKCRRSECLPMAPKCWHTATPRRRDGEIDSKRDFEVFVERN